MPPLFPVSATPSWSSVPADPTEVTRHRLSTEIESTRRAAAAARERVAARDAEVRAALHEELEQSRRALAAIEDEYRAAIASVREAARAESERILREAREHAAQRAGQPASPAAAGGRND